MMKNIALIAIMTALLATACEAEVEDPEAGPSPAVTVEDDTAEDDVDVEATPTGCAEVSSAGGAPAPLTMRDSFFEPNCLVVSSTQEMTLVNAGDLPHNFSIRDTDVSEDVDPGEEEESEDLFENLDAGTHEFFCRFHEAEGMVGTIVIE
ncbi:MAG TPA: cupredoxin domain-containing protein [Actinomycetota bacterium]